MHGFSLAGSLLPSILPPVESWLNNGGGDTGSIGGSLNERGGSPPKGYSAPSRGTSGGLLSGSGGGSEQEREGGSLVGSSGGSLLGSGGGSELGSSGGPASSGESAAKACRVSGFSSSVSSNCCSSEAKLGGGGATEGIGGGQESGNGFLIGLRGFTAGALGDDSVDNGGDTKSRGELLGDPGICADTKIRENTNFQQSIKLRD